MLRNWCMNFLWYLIVEWTFYGSWRVKFLWHLIGAWTFYGTKLMSERFKFPNWCVNVFYAQVCYTMNDQSTTFLYITDMLLDEFNKTPNGSDNVEYETDNPFRHPLYMRIIYSVAYITIMIVAIVGNAMVVAVVYRNQSMHSVTNYFIVNLAIADIMVAVICLPMTLLFNMYKGKKYVNIITKTCLFKNTLNFTTKNWKFADKKIWYSSYFCSKHR